MNNSLVHYIAKKTISVFLIFHQNIITCFVSQMTFRFQLTVTRRSIILGESYPLPFPFISMAVLWLSAVFSHEHSILETFLANHKSHEYHMTNSGATEEKSPDMLLWVVFPKSMLAKYDCKFHCF